MRRGPIAVHSAGGNNARRAGGSARARSGAASRQIAMLE